MLQRSVSGVEECRLGVAAVGVWGRGVLTGCCSGRCVGLRSVDWVLQRSVSGVEECRLSVAAVRV